MGTVFIVAFLFAIALNISILGYTVCKALGQIYEELKRGNDLKYLKDKK